MKKRISVAIIGCGVVGKRRKKFIEKNNQLASDFEMENVLIMIDEEGDLAEDEKGDSGRISKEEQLCTSN